MINIETFLIYGHNFNAFQNLWLLNFSSIFSLNVDYFLVILLENF